MLLHLLIISELAESYISREDIQLFNVSARFGGALGWYWREPNVKSTFLWFRWSSRIAQWRRLVAERQCWLFISELWALAS